MSELSPPAATGPVEVSATSASLSAPAMIASALAAADEPPSGSACPPPLAWQEVLAAYQADSQPWELSCGPHRLTGRAWGQGPPLYLLNGFVATAELYALLVWLLRDSFRCVVFDTTRAAGTRPGRPTVDDYANDLLAAADFHGDSSLRVFAPTFGTMVALQASLKAPDRITGLVLQHGFAHRRLSWTERCLSAWCRRSGRLLQSMPWRRRIQELNHRRWFPPFDGTRFEFLVASTGTIPLADLADKARAMDSARLDDRLTQVACPVMLLRTEGQGQLEAAAHDDLQRGLLGCRSEWLHSAGLHPYLTHPHRVAKLVKSFFLEDAAPDPPGNPQQATPAQERLS